jgi:hypothetical protein
MKEHHRTSWIVFRLPYLEVSTLATSYFESKPDSSLDGLDEIFVATLLERAPPRGRGVMRQ